MKTGSSDFLTSLNGFPDISINLPKLNSLKFLLDFNTISSEMSEPRNLHGNFLTIRMALS